jgi:hypothetical protein
MTFALRGRIGTALVLFSLLSVSANGCSSDDPAPAGGRGGAAGSAARDGGGAAGSGAAGRGGSSGTAGSSGSGATGGTAAGSAGSAGSAGEADAGPDGDSSVEDAADTGADAPDDRADATDAGCGSCSTNGGTSRCIAGACAIVSCEAGRADCNGLASDGCEATVANDASNCGACGNPCRLANATARCDAGVCAVLACATGYENCDSDPKNGCESFVAKDPFHCGIPIRTTADSAETPAISRTLPGPA